MHALAGHKAQAGKSNDAVAARARGAGRLARAAVLLAAGLLLAPLRAEPGADVGRRLFTACAACHGERGQGDGKGGAPNIAGLDAAYVARQLHNFAAGLRGQDGDSRIAGMRAALQALPEAGAQQALAAFVASLPAAPASALAPAPAGNRDAGRNYFNAICSACHNSNAMGSAALSAPRLAGTDPRYLLRQLAAFRNGARGASPDDRYGAQMRRMVLNLPGTATERDIVAYLAGLPVVDGTPRGTR